MRRPWSVLFALAACGRVGFDPASGDAPTEEPPPDAPLPRMICADAHSPVPAGGDLDLAIAAMPRGYFAAWAPVTGGRLTVAVLDDARLITRGPEDENSGLVFTGVAGLTNVGTALSMVTLGPNASHLTWAAPHDESGAVVVKSETAIPSRPSIASSDDSRVLVRAIGQDLVMSYLTGDGAVGTMGVHTAESSITAIAVTDGPDHGHITWMEDTALQPRCLSFDVIFGAMPSIDAVNIQNVNSDCHEVRAATGPAPGHAAFIASRNSRREIVTVYLVSPKQIAILSNSGRAPRAIFDGDSHFWIAWIEEQPAPRLRIARYSVVGPPIEFSDLSSWTPAGDEAFEFVQRDGVTYLAVLGASSLNVLTLCPP